MVAGIEVSGFGSDLNQTNSNSLQVFVPLSIQTVTTNIKSIYTVTGRLGYAFYPGWLGYAKAGFASARIDTSGQTVPPIPPLVLNWSTSQWHDGYVVGAGVERQLTKNITLAGEYNYIGLYTKDHVGAVSGGNIGPANQVIHSVNGNIQSVMVRVITHSWNRPLIELEKSIPAFRHGELTRPIIATASCFAVFCLSFQGPKPAQFPCFWRKSRYIAAHLTRKHGSKGRPVAAGP